MSLPFEFGLGHWLLIGMALVVNLGVLVRKRWPRLALLTITAARICLIFGTAWLSVMFVRGWVEVEGFWMHLLLCLATLFALAVTAAFWWTLSHLRRLFLPPTQEE